MLWRQVDPLKNRFLDLFLVGAHPYCGRFAAGRSRNRKFGRYTASTVNRFGRYDGAACFFVEMPILFFCLHKRHVTILFLACRGRQPRWQLAGSSLPSKSSSRRTRCSSSPSRGNRLWIRCSSLVPRAKLAPSKRRIPPCKHRLCRFRHLLCTGKTQLPKAVTIPGIRLPVRSVSRP